MEAWCNEVAVFEAIKLFKKLPTTDPNEKNTNGKSSLYDLPHHLSRLDHLYRLNHTDEEHREVFLHAMKYAYLGDEYITGTFAADEWEPAKKALEHFMKTGEPFEGYRFYGNHMHQVTTDIKEDVADALQATTE